MPQRELPPIRTSTRDFDSIEAQIIRILTRMIYAPIMRELGHPVKGLQNSMEDLCWAIQTGRLRYYRGRFTGQLNSTLTRELRSIGAEWDGKQGSFAIPQSALPPDVKIAISVSESRFNQKIKRIEGMLNQFSPEDIAAQFNGTEAFDRTLFKVERSFEKNVGRVTLAPKLTDHQRGRIASEYSENMQLYIQDFAKKEILELRQQVAQRVMDGQRYEGMVQTIKDSYGVSERKAKFLARQETQLMMTKYTQTRYQDAGVEKYKWKCANKPHSSSPNKNLPGHVRYYHAQNDNQVFTWSSPPVVDKQGHKKHPGQDYNCDCIAIPIVEFA